MLSTSLVTRRVHFGFGHTGLWPRTHCLCLHWPWLWPGLCPSAASCPAPGRGGPLHVEFVVCVCTWGKAVSAERL